MARVGRIAAGALLAAGAASAQVTIQGTVTDAATGRPLADALIYVPGAAFRMVQSDPGGKFRLVLPGAPDRLVIARVGYRPDTVVANANESVRVRLVAAPLSLAPVVVAAAAGGGLAGQVIRGLDLHLRPARSAQDLLRLVPGLVIAQHAGGGKAEQLFLRGFDADHGTDVAISVDDTPVNMVSHAHGQGYADLHFLPPEVVEAVVVRKGPFDVRDGNLATAGAVAVRTRERIGAGAELGLASFGERTGALSAPLVTDRGAGYLVARRHVVDGPFASPQGLAQTTGFARWVMPAGAGRELVFTASGFQADWFASGQVPERAVRSGRISRFGAIDDSEGGVTSRYELSSAIRGRTGAATWQVRAYAVRYRFRLFSNFTFAARDSIHGDGIEQEDDRWTTGASVSIDGPAGTAGVAFRGDRADVLLAAQQRRTRIGPITASRIVERHLSAWVGRGLAPGAHTRISLGVRGDLFRFDVANRFDGDPPDGITRPRPEGARTLGRLSPRATVTWLPGSGWEVFASGGLGFHSNDARDVVLSRTGHNPLPGALALETGLRRSGSQGAFGLALWRTDLESELVFVGDEGVTEPSGRTRRVGAEVEGRIRLLPVLWADADLSLARARLRDEAAGADQVPLAPRRTLSAGLTLRDAGPVEASLRVRHVGSRPAEETGEIVARGHTLADLGLAWTRGCIQLRAAVENLLNAEWNEAQFATTSRLREEPQPVTELHFTPGPPRTGKLAVSVACK